MPKVMVLYKGRKRKLRAMQWSLPEKLSAAALFLLLGGFCAAVALWAASVYSSNPEEPRLEIRR